MKPTTKRQHIKPIHFFRCSCCGYSFHSSSYDMMLNRFTNRMIETEDCPSCGCAVQKEV